MSHEVATTPASPALDTFVREWVGGHRLACCEVDCALAVMLKILDGKCKMNASDKVVMAALYRVVRHLPGERLPGAELHALVDEALADKSGDLKERVYEKRVLAETMISRPVMKRFKQRIREEGLFACLERGA